MKYKLTQVHRVLWVKIVDAPSKKEALEDNQNNIRWKETELLHSQKIKATKFGDEK